jgi:hypothetical protein
MVIRLLKTRLVMGHEFRLVLEHGNAAGSQLETLKLVAGVSSDLWS